MSLTKLVLVPLLVALLPFLVACETATPLGQQHGGPPAMQVRITPVEATSVIEKTRYLATLKSRKSVPLKSQVAGQISDIVVQAGANVAKDAVLILLDPSKQQETVNTLIATTESFKAEKGTAEETLRSLISTKESKLAVEEFSRKQVERYTQLLGQGAISKEQVDQKNTDLRTAIADVHTAESQIKAQEAVINKAQKQINQSKAAIKEQQAQLRYFTIRAPFAGTVSDIPVKVGEYITPDTHLTTINENHFLEVYINVPTDRAADLKSGLAVRLLDGKENILGQGKVIFISPHVSNDSQSILVKALYDNSNNTLRSGQLVTAEIVWNQNQGLLVPTESVSMLAGQAFVFVAKDEGKGTIAKQVPVALGEIIGEKYQIKSGIKADDKVVSSGIQNLVDGVPITAKE